MATSAAVPFAKGSQTRIAGLVHTVLVLAVLGGWTFYGNLLAHRLSMAVQPNRARFYAVSMLFEWLLFLFVLAGVRYFGAPIWTVLGARWRSFREVFRDLGIAAGFWVVTYIVLAVLAFLLRIAAHGPDLRYMLPHRGAELAWWIALSLTAGVCEEAIFRGYLQRQFLALTKSAPAAIALSAAVFGAAHAYQGWRKVVLIALFGAMFGYLAHWRRSVRPGMIAHAFQDGASGVFAFLLKP